MSVQTLRFQEIEKLVEEITYDVVEDFLVDSHEAAGSGSHLSGVRLGYFEKKCTS